MENNTNANVNVNAPEAPIGLTSTLKTVGGEEFGVNLDLVYLPNVKEEVMSRATEVTLSLAKISAQIKSGYSDMMPWIARANAEETYKNFKGVKSMNQYIKQVIGASAATASEMIKVAKTFYTSTGEVINGYGAFTYSELIQLAKLSDDDREAVRNKILALEKHTRDDVKQAIKLLTVKEDKSQEDSKDQDQDKDQAHDSAEKHDEKNEEQTHDDSTVESESESFEQTAPEETPFSEEDETISKYGSTIDALMAEMFDYCKEVLDSKNFTKKNMTEMLAKFVACSIEKVYTATGVIVTIPEDLAVKLFSK